MIFVDYNGTGSTVGRDDVAHDHVGHYIIPAPGSSVALILSTGVQGIEDKVWAAVRGHSSVGWDAKAKLFKGHLVINQKLKVLPDLDGKSVDWAKMRSDLLGENGVIKRTVHASVLHSLVVHAAKAMAKNPSWVPVHKAAEAQLKDVRTGFNGGEISIEDAQSRMPKVVNG